MTASDPLPGDPQQPPDAVLVAAWCVGAWCDEYDALPRERQQRIYDLNAAMHALPVGRNVVVTETRLAALEAVAAAVREWVDEGGFVVPESVVTALAGLPEGEQPHDKPVLSEHARDRLRSGTAPKLTVDPADLLPIIDEPEGEQ